MTLAPSPARSRLDLVGLGPAVLADLGTGLTDDEVDWARTWVSFRLAVDPEREVEGRATVAVVEVGRMEVVPAGPGFRSIAARFSRGACRQLSHQGNSTLHVLTMEGVPSDFTPTLALLVNPILGSPTPNLA
jgi:hypothetical protein